MGDYGRCGQNLSGVIIAGDSLLFQFMREY